MLLDLLSFHVSLEARDSCEGPEICERRLGSTKEGTFSEDLTKLSHLLESPFLNAIESRLVHGGFSEHSEDSGSPIFHLGHGSGKIFNGVDDHIISPASLGVSRVVDSRLYGAESSDSLRLVHADTISLKDGDLTTRTFATVFKGLESRSRDTSICEFNFTVSENLSSSFGSSV